ncbi:PEP-CTERM sorting domain-containing protein [Desulforhopalus sp. 52FAK]
MKKIKSVFFVVTVVCALSIATIASSLTLDCELTDLDDSLGTAGDLWQATYPLNFYSDPSNPTLNEVFYVFDDRYNFAITFDSDLYESIEWVDKPDVSGYFDVSITQQFSPYYGGYIQFSFNADTFGGQVFPFSIQFVWLGDGDPDSQSWLTYRDIHYSPIWAIPSSYGDVNITEINRLDTPVPEPSTILLFGVGLAGIAGCRRKFGRQ